MHTDHEQALGAQILKKCFHAKISETFHPLPAGTHCAWATLPKSSSRPLLATLARSRNLAHASLETAVQHLVPEDCTAAEGLEGPI